MFPPTFNAPPIPTPPSTTNAPLLVDVESTVLIMCPVPPIFIFFSIPTPPSITKAPVLTLFDCFVLLIKTVPLTPKFLFIYALEL